MSTTPLRMADINIPPINHAASSSKRRPILSSAPFSTAKVTTDIDTDLSAFSLEVTLGHLVDFLVSKLDSLYPPHLIAALRRSISSHLTPKLAPTWDPLNPSAGSGVRSLIALPGKFPTPLVKAALETSIDPMKWTRAISETEEWEIWVDPGSVCFREGGWAFADDAFDNKMYKQTLHTVWHAPLPIETSDDYFPGNSISEAVPVQSSLATRKPNAPIRAPAVFRIPSSPMPLMEGMRSLSLRQPIPTTTKSPFDVGGPDRNSRDLQINGFSSNGGIAMMAGSSPLVKRSLPNQVGDASSMQSASAGPGWNDKPLPLKGKRIAPQVIAMPIGDAAVGAGRRSASPVLPSSLSRSGHLAVVAQTPRSISLGTPGNAADLLALLNRKPEPLKDERISFDTHRASYNPPKTPPRLDGATEIHNTPGSVVTVKPRSPSSVIATAGASTSIASSSPRTDTTNSPGTAARVQGYDGGNVGVLGGGVKLGGQGVPKTPNMSLNRARSASGTSVLSGMSAQRTVSGSSSAISEEGGSPEHNTVATSPLQVEASPSGGIVHPHQPKRRRGRPQSRPYFGGASPKGNLPLQPGTGIAGQPGSGPTMGGPYPYQGGHYGQMQSQHVMYGHPTGGPLPQSQNHMPSAPPGNVPAPAWNHVGLINGLPAMTQNGGGGWGVNPAVLNVVAPPIGGGVPGQPGTAHHNMPHIHPGQLNSHVANAAGINVAAWNLGVASGMTSPANQGVRRS